MVRRLVSDRRAGRVRRAWSRCVAIVLALGMVGAGVEVAAFEPAASEPAASEPAGEEPAAGAVAAILPLAVDGEVSEVDQQTLADELVEGLRRGAFGVVAPADVSAADPGASTCANADCVQRIAAATKATHVVRARVVLEDRDYTVSVDLYDGQ